MQHVDVTSADMRLIAHGTPDGGMAVLFQDAMTGKENRVVITPRQLTCVLASLVMTKELNPESDVYKTCMQIQDAVTNVRFMP